MQQEKTKKKFYTCKWDKPFKEIFLREENQDLLKKLLEETLEVEIYRVQELNVEKRVGNVFVRGKRVDVLLDTNIGRIGIELNAKYNEYLHVRNLAYQCDTYAHYTFVGSEYSEEPKIVQINFTYGLESNLETRKMDLEVKEEYWVQNKREIKYADNFLIIEMNMDKIMKVWYAKNELEIEKYKYFIMLDLNEKELEELSKKDRMVGKYMENIERLNENPDFHIYMTEEEDQRKIYNTEMRIARETGMKQGLSQGLEQGLEQGILQGVKQNALETAKKMISKNKSIEEIQEFTELTIKEIEDLKKQ